MAKAQADADAAKAKADADAAAKASEKNFSQDDLDRLAGKARQDGRTAAEKELLEKLGVTDLDTAAAAIKAAKDADEANKTELQKANEAREKAEKEAERANRLATTSIAISRIEGALRDSGLKPERIPAALKLIDLATLKVEGTEVSGVPEAVEGLKEISPEWFGPASTSRAPDASRTPEVPADFRSAPRADVERHLMDKYGIRL